MKRQILAVLAALGLTAVALGCGGKQIKLPDVPATVTPVVGAADQDVHAAAIKALGILESAGYLTADLARVESQLNQSGTLTPGIHAGLVSGIAAVSRAALVAIDRIDRGITDWATLRGLIESVLTPIQSLVTAAQAAGSQVQSAFGDVLTLLPSIVGHALPGGVQ
jgi:hypothetical protein